MNCPYCGEEMESGYLQGNRGIEWRRAQNGAVWLDKENGEFRLGSPWKVPIFPAYLCRGCQKIIMDIPSKK